ncbi:hypothetical protein KY284_033118 [Solanum tuberosum]|nr:hypothetical protein KY284_033118 [Solanum tuberosum]
MGRGRPRRATQRPREEEINHGLASSTTAAQTNRRETNDEVQLTTPDGPPPAPMTATSKEKGKAVVDEQWPELSKQRGTGSGKPQILLGSNGTVT